MERRLKIAKKLLNPADSVLIVTIDEKEYLRLGLLLEQTFPGAAVQMVSSQINPAASSRAGAFGRVDEYIFFVRFGAAVAQRLSLGREWVSTKGRTHTGLPRWDMLRRSGEGARRQDSPGGFYPVYVDPSGPRVVKVGAPLPAGVSVPEHVDGAIAVLPIRKDGSEGRWMWKPSEFERRLAQGRVRISGSESAGYVVSVLKDGEYAKILNGEFEVLGRDVDNSMVFERAEGDTVRAIPGTQWRITSHDATQYGSRLLKDSFLPGRDFPFPKSLYAVEDTLRFFVADKPDALILDFFSGSGTTAHAVMRLNKLNGGRRRSISVTNNEVSAEEEAALMQRGLRPGDAEWEALGICDYVTKPRIASAITGHVHGNVDQAKVEGRYKRSVTTSYELRHEGECTNIKSKLKKDGSLPKCRKTHRPHSITTFEEESPMSDGFDENVEFFTLTYLNPQLVELDMAFASIAPLLWMRAGAQGRRIDERTDTFDVADTYAVLFELDQSSAFIDAVDQADGLRVAYIVTDDEPQFQAVAAQLPEGIKAVRLYESYLRTFQINTERA